MYRFASRPAWLVSHVLVLALVAVLVSLGLWQLDRLDQRRERNELVTSRFDQPPVDVGSLFGSTPEEARFRQVTATGSYLETSSILIDNRSLDGRPGAWLLTPLELDAGNAAGRTVMVNRGFVPYVDGIEAALPESPEAPVDLVGIIETDAGRSCAATPAEQSGISFRYACVDLARIAADLGLDGVAPFELRSSVSDPVEGPSAPSPVPPPELDEGPHLSYAVQWFIFASIGVIGYPLVLRRVARQRLPDDALR